MMQKQAEFRKGYFQRKAVIDKAKTDGKAKSLSEWRVFKAGLDFSGSTERKCGRCFYTWKYKYGKPTCPKCNGKMMDGVMPYKDTSFVLQWWHLMPNQVNAY